MIDPDSSCGLSSVFPPGLIAKPGTHCLVGSWMLRLREDGPGHRGQEITRGSGRQTPGQRPVVRVKSSPAWKDRAVGRNRAGLKEAMFKSGKLWLLRLGSYWWRTHLLHFHLRTRVECWVFFLKDRYFSKLGGCENPKTKIPQQTPDPLT